MKIVHTEASCGWGGQEIRTLEEARGLAQRGHQVSLLCPQESQIFREAKRFGVSATALPIGRKNLSGMLTLRKWLRQNLLEVINTHSSTDSWLAALACSTMHPAPAIVRTRHISAPVPNNFATRWLYSKATSHIVTTGEALRQQLIKNNRFPADMLTSVPTGIDPEHFKPGDKQAARLALQTRGIPINHPLLLIVATLRSWKGHVFLLEAIAGLTDVHLIIVGDGPNRVNIENRLQSLQLADRVSLVGQEQDVRPWLQAADIFVLPSYANEGVPQAILQAMMSGLPVVSTKVGAIAEAVIDGTTGFLVTPSEVQALHAALKYLLNNPERAKDMGQAGRELALNNFSYQGMLDKMETLFRSIISPAEKPDAS